MALKFQWRYGENDEQRYYDVTVNGDYLCVFTRKWQSDIWMGAYQKKGCGIITIHDKTYNDRQRRKQGLPKNCDVFELKSCACLCSAKPEYMMQKVEHCYKYNKIEVRR